MTHKIVTVVYTTPPEDDADYHSKRALTETFMDLASQCPDAEITMKAKRFTFTVDRATFQSLIDNDLLPMPIADAFNKADMLMSEVDVERSGFLARLVDSFRYNSTMTRGIPVLQAPQFAAGMVGVNVTVKRYGLAPKQQ